MATRYGKSSQKEVEKEMRKFKKGTAHSGPKLKKVTSRKQAIAIALSKARKKGAKVPSVTPGNKSASTKKKISKGKTTKKSTINTTRGSARTGTKKRKISSSNK